MRDPIRGQVQAFRSRHGERTQEDLAARVGVSRRTITALEKDDHSPSVGLAIRMARIFGVGVEDVFSLTDSD